MIKFFRKIRQKLLEQNRVSKYLLYAFGEIVLVVIGILIALQVNNWNEQRISSKEEKKIIQKLHSDFLTNKEIIEKSIQSLLLHKDANTRLMSLIGASKEELSKHNLDSLFSSGTGANDVSFADNTFKNLLQTDKLGLLQNDDLLELLYKWKELSDIRLSREQKLDNWINNFYLPYMMPKISFKEMDTYSHLSWTGKSVVKPDYYPLFQEVEFENYLDNILWFNQKLHERSLETQTLIEKIIKATSNYD